MRARAISYFSLLYSSSMQYQQHSDSLSTTTLLELDTQLQEPQPGNPASSSWPVDVSDEASVIEDKEPNEALFQHPEAVALSQAYEGSLTVPLQKASIALYVNIPAQVHNLPREQQQRQPGDGYRTRPAVRRACVGSRVLMLHAMANVHVVDANGWTRPMNAKMQKERNADVPSGRATSRGKPAQPPRQPTPIVGICYPMCLNIHSLLHSPFYIIKPYAFSFSFRAKRHCLFCHLGSAILSGIFLWHVLSTFGDAFTWHRVAHPVQNEQTSLWH